MMNHEITQLVDRYIAFWHEPDAEQRRRSVAHLWAEDGVQFTQSREIRGHKALEERVETAHEEFVKTGGFIFRRGGDVAATGTIFLLLSDDGRIRFDYQF